MKLLSYLKKILLFIIKEIFSFIIKFSLFIFVGTAILAGIFSTYFNRQETIILNTNSYVVINLSNSFPEKKLDLFLSERENSFYDLIRTIDFIKFDEKVDGVILKLDSLSLTKSQIEEFSQKITELKKHNKDVISFSTSLNKNNYYLASYTNNITMPPTEAANINIFPYLVEQFYIKKLADKIGVEFNVVPVGNFKSFGETYSKENMSPEYRENTVRILDSIYEDFLTDIKANRKKIPANFKEELESGSYVMASVFDFKKDNFIDNLLYFDDIVKNIGKDKLISFDQYLTLKKRTLNADNPKLNTIGLITLDGTILKGGNELDRVIAEDNTIGLLNDALNDENIKAVIIRINSPGGSALTSNIISKKIKELDIKKPVYISMGGIAASGGYYIASAGRKIFASPTTITGSIGVVSLIPNVNNLLDKIGVNPQAIQKGDYSDIYSSTSKMTAEKYSKIYNSSVKIYDEFLNIVSENRKLDKTHLNEIAQGKIWLGKEALENGLIDELGGLEDTIKKLASDFNITNYQIKEITPDLNLNLLLDKYKNYLTAPDLKSFIINYELFNRPLLYTPYVIEEDNGL